MLTNTMLVVQRTARRPLHNKLSLLEGTYAGDPGGRLSKEGRGGGLHRGAGMGVIPRTLPRDIFVVDCHFFCNYFTEDNRIRRLQYVFW